MFSLRLIGNYLEISIETKLSSAKFQEVNTFVSSLPGSYYVQSEYKWMIPKYHIDRYCQMYLEVTAFHNTVEEIKGIEEVLLPEFPMLDDYSDLLLEPREFQKQGISFLTHIGSGIMGDDMGLGKTVQTMAAAYNLYKLGKVKKVLVICPASLKYQWKKEIMKFLGIEAIVIDGKTPKQKEKAFQLFAESDTLFGIINYELVRNMIEQMKDVHFDMIICDEAHRLKNRLSLTYKAVSSLSSTHRIASTGTPLQNNAEELYALMEWVRPGVLGPITDFKKRYVVYADKFGRRYVYIGCKRQGELRRIISPFMLRRLKKDVAKDLPPMIHHRRDVEMNKAQLALYQTIQQDFLDYLEELKDMQTLDEEARKKKEDKILGYIYLMTAVSDHPRLLLRGKGMSTKYHEMIPRDITSPKLQELVSICKEALEAGTKKMVIFTQFRQMQDIIVEELSKIGRVAVLHGSLDGEKRQLALDTFTEDPNYHFFVMTDAGNYGLNIQIANLLINYDCPWNPAILDQREGRVHRIGTTHEVVDIINLVTLETVDEKIQDTLEKKRNLSKAIIERNVTERSMLNELIASIKKKKAS